MHQRVRSKRTERNMRSQEWNLQPEKELSVVFSAPTARTHLELPCLPLVTTCGRASMLKGETNSGYNSRVLRQADKSQGAGSEIWHLSPDK